MDIKLFTAILVGKTISAVNKLAGTGATAAPGLYALKIDPNLVKKLSQKIENTILISGTNGKTTTARLTFDMLSKKENVLHNRQGSNLLRGLASTLIVNSSIFGFPNAKTALWEVDEATLPQALENTSPKILVLLNLFRDQLDRYGEVDSVREKWQKTFNKVKNKPLLILNADDPGISYLAKNYGGKSTFFGIETKEINLAQTKEVGDINRCLNCNSSLVYSLKISSHAGHYKCLKCGLIRPKTQIRANNIEFKNDFSTKLSLQTNKESFDVSYSLPGVYNVYNVLAAVSIANTLGVKTTQIKEALSLFKPAFGRFQKITIKGKKAIFFLIKNPTGANEVLRAISKKKNLNILTILNDNFADGRDVSWIWDTNWELVQKTIKNVSVSGTRSWDMAARLKYAEIKLDKNNVHENIYSSIISSVSKLNKDDTLIILPTYTALLKIQEELQKKGEIGKWHRG